ncbi:MAG: hypothetical protein HYV63_10610 [Candidatus Schekmanbacteria bacterium]|nr:hypothetical protein [Candidatus Schekmanbacteria bacterium]
MRAGGPRTQVSHRHKLPASVNDIRPRPKIRLRMFADRLQLCSPGALANTMTIESLTERRSARNEVLTSLLARCPVPSGIVGLETDRVTLMDKRGEGVAIILDRSERLSGRRPDFRMFDDAELLLTIWAAEPPDAGTRAVTEESVRLRRHPICVRLGGRR